MSILKTSNIYDLTGVSGFSFSGGGVTVEGTLTVSTLTVNGAIVGQSSYVLPSQSGSSGKFLSNDGSKLQWKDLSVESGIRSMSVYTGGNTWNKPNGVGTIHVLVTGAGGGGSGFGESGGAGGHSEKVINVANINSVGITVGSPGGGAYYNGCGGNGNASSFGSYLSANGGVGGNCSQQHAGGLGGHGSGGELNIHGGGGSGHGSYHSYGRHYPGPSFWGGGQPGCHHRNHHYAHSHESYAAWGAGGGGAEFGYRGARGREGIVVVYEYYGD